MLQRLIATLALMGLAALALPTGRQDPLPDEVDSDETRRVLGSSVVTSVSVIMDLGHGGAALLSESPGQHADADNAAGSSQQSETFANSPLFTDKRPVGSPPALMSPDRYEFYTFDESGELVRRLMTLEQIQSLIAGGDDAHRLAALTADLEANTPPSPSASDPQEEVVANVQQVLAEELLASIQKNGSEPQEGEVEVEAVVQEVPPPPSSSPEPAEQGAFEESHEENTSSSSYGSEGIGGSTDSSDEGSQVEGANTTSQEVNFGGASGGIQETGMPSSPQDSAEMTSEEFGNENASSNSDSSSDVSVTPGDEMSSTPPNFASQQSTSVMDDVEALTLAFSEKTTTEAETESSVGEDGKITLSQHPETISKNETMGVQVNDSIPAFSNEDSEGSKETLEGKPVQNYAHTTGGLNDNAEFTNKNPPSVIHQKLPEESEPFPDPIPEIILSSMHHHSEQTNNPVVTMHNENTDATLSIEDALHEAIGISTEYPPSFDHQVDEIPNLSHTVDFQPPEEADLSAYFPDYNQTSKPTSDEKEEDSMKIQGLLGLFSDKFSSLMGSSDTFNNADSHLKVTTEMEDVAIQDDTKDPNQSEFQDPSASLMPPLTGEEETTITQHLGSGVTEISNIKDQATDSGEEIDEEDSDLLDELAESVSGILSQVSDFVDDSEEGTSKKPFEKPVHSVRPPTASPDGTTLGEDQEKYTETTHVGIFSQETSTPAGHTHHKVAMSGEESTSTDGMHGVVSLKPVNIGHQTDSFPYSSTESFTEKIPTTFDPMSLSNSFSTDSSVKTDVVTVSSAEEPDKDVSKITSPTLSIKIPNKQNETVESGDGYANNTSTMEEGEDTSVMDNISFSDGSAASSTESSDAENTGGENSTPIKVAQEDIVSSMNNSDNDDRFDTATKVMSEDGGFESSTAVQHSELEIGSNEKDDAVNGITVSSASTENVKYSEDTSVVASEESTEGLSPFKESILHGSTQKHPDSFNTGFESSATEQHSELETGGSEKNDAGDETNDNSATTENIKPSEDASVMNSEESTEGLSPIEVSAPHENNQEHSTVSIFSPVVKPILNKTGEEYLLEEMHKVAAEESDPMLSAYADDERPDEQPSSPKDEYSEPTSDSQNAENGDEEKEAADGEKVSTVAADHYDSIHSSTEAAGEPSTETETPAPTSDYDSKIEEGASEQTTSDEAESPEEIAIKTPLGDALGGDTSLSADNDLDPNSPDAIKPTTYRPDYTLLPTPQADGINDSHSSASPDDLPDPNGLSPLLGQEKPVPPSQKPSVFPVSSSTDKPPKASTVTPGGSVVPPLMPAFPPAPAGNVGLEATSSSIDPDVKLFVDLCNDLAFSLYSQVTGASQSVPNIRGTHGGGVQTRSLVVSPFAISSLLAMVFLGARGPTSEQMNDLLHLDDVVTFNPHLVLQNVTESVITSPGVSAAAFVRELYSDKSKGHLLEFYKARAKAFYEGHVEEVDFKDVNDVIRRRTNHLVRWQTRGRVPEYLRGSSLRLRPPLAALSANFFEADCQRASSSGSDGEMYFEVPAMGRRRRRLVPIPAVVWRGVFLAGHDPGLDATALELRHGGGEVSTVLVLPGRHGHSVSDDPTGGLARLEAWLAKGGKASWSSVLRSAVPRGPIEVQLPRFAHRSVLNVTGALSRMGLQDLFTGGKADLRGLDGGLGGSLHLSDAIQMTAFGVCAEDGNSRRHLETYPSAQRTGRAGGETEEEDEDWPSTAAEAARELPLALRPRQARIPRPPQGSGVVLPRLRFDRPFLYFVRHNPSGFILLMGRFNPRLFP
ncbi:serine-rich adhesin for platelets [Hetaerina americana]|uniref:serine-rich adhesin for platelets n=1 Tax=Hetaerina americana TaxID=62018 RepID=UPI003A7F13F5